MRAIVRPPSRREQQIVARAYALLSPAGQLAILKALVALSPAEPEAGAFRVRSSDCKGGRWLWTAPEL